MGAEFLKKINRSYRRHINKKRAELARADLFTQTPKEKPRCALAFVSSGAKLNDGDYLIIETKGQRPLASKGNSVVAEFANPPP